MLESKGKDHQRPSKACAPWVLTTFPVQYPALRQHAPDTVLNIHLRFPLTAHPGTPPITTVTGTAAPLLAIIGCVAVHRCVR